MKVPFAVAAITLACTFAADAVQSSQTATLSGTLTVRTQGATTAVHGESTDKTQGDFMFCIDQDRTKPQIVEFKGPGRVLYRPMPRPNLPEGITVTGPEMVEPALAVIANDGKAWVFLARGQEPMLASDPTLAKAVTVPVRGLRRTDWAAAKGPRRGVSMEGCLAPGGN